MKLSYHKFFLQEGEIERRMEATEASMAISLDQFNNALLTPGEYIQIDKTEEEPWVVQLIQSEEKGYVAMEELGRRPTSNRRGKRSATVASPIDRSKVVLVRIMELYAGTKPDRTTYSMVHSDQKEVTRSGNCCWVPESFVKENGIPCFVIHATAIQKDDKLLLHFGIHNVFLLRYQKDENGIISDMPEDFDSFYSPRKLVEKREGE